MLPDTHLQSCSHTHDLLDEKLNSDQERIANLRKFDSQLESDVERLASLESPAVRINGLDVKPRLGFDDSKTNYIALVKRPPMPGIRRARQRDETVI